MLTLLFDAAIPPKVDRNDFRSHRQVKSNAPCFERSNHNPMIHLVGEIIDRLLPLHVTLSTMILESISW